jgi:hypothetical protein
MVGGFEHVLPFWQGRRVQKALKRAVAYRTLSAAVKALKPTTTPLQIADASR